MFYSAGNFSAPMHRLQHIPFISQIQPIISYKLEEEEEEEGDGGRFDNDLFLRRHRNKVLMSLSGGLSLYHNHKAEIEVSEIQFLGRAVVSNASLIEANICGKTHKVDKWKKAIEEFIAICNNPSTKERHIQHYLETFPEFIVDDQYTNVISQAVIENESDNLRTDFVLIPDHQDNFSKIIEIKLPTAQITKKHPHDPLSYQIYQGLKQLENYRESFQNPATVNKFRKRYGYEIIKPKLHLLIGRSSSIHDLVRYKNATGNLNVTVETYDALFSTLKKRFKQ